MDKSTSKYIIPFPNHYSATDDVKVTPGNLEEFLPWACAKYGFPFRVDVTRKIVEVQKGNKLRVSSMSKLKPNFSQEKSESDFSEVQAPRDTVYVELKYDKDNLIHIRFEMSKPIPRELLAIIALIVEFHPNLNGITITRGADQFIVYELSKLLSISNITALYLDGNVIKEANYDILLDKINHLQILSLARCRIGDIGVKNIAAKLHYPTPASMTLCMLNVSSNNLTNASCKYIAEALRTNRKLSFLNMAGNKITDDGGLAIIHVLQQFPFTANEMIAFRERYMDYLKRRQEVIDRYVEIGGYEKKREKKKTKLRDAKSFIGKSFVNDCDRMVETAIKNYGDFEDPMIDCSSSGGLRYCPGNNTLGYMNLAYNSLSFSFLKALIEVVNYQQSLPRPLATKGLINVVLEGNPLPSRCIELVELETYLELGLTLSTKKMSVVKRRLNVAPQTFRGVDSTEFTH